MQAYRYQIKRKDKIFSRIYIPGTAVISYDSDGGLVRLLVAGGTHIHDSRAQNGDTLIEMSGSALPLQITFEGETAILAGGYTGIVRLFAPAVETVVMDAIIIDFERDGDYISFEL